MPDTTMPPKTRTITLTDRRPVQIVQAEWPVIAQAKGDSGTIDDYARYQQASARGELDDYSIRVRQHADGRAIVSAVLDAGSWTQTKEWKGGELLDAGADIPAAIRRVGEDGGIPDSVIRECIAHLPAEQI